MAAGGRLKRARLQRPSHGTPVSEDFDNDIAVPASTNPITAADTLQHSRKRQKPSAAADYGSPAAVASARIVPQQPRHRLAIASSSAVSLCAACDSNAAHGGQSGLPQGNPPAKARLSAASTPAPPCEDAHDSTAADAGCQGQLQPSQAQAMQPPQAEASMSTAVHWQLHDVARSTGAMTQACAASELTDAAAAHQDHAAVPQDNAAVVLAQQLAVVQHHRIASLSVNAADSMQPCLVPQSNPGAVLAHAAGQCQSGLVASLAPPRTARHSWSTHALQHVDTANSSTLVGPSTASAGSGNRPGSVNRLGSRAAAGAITSA